MARSALGGELRASPWASIAPRPLAGLAALIAIHTSTVAGRSVLRSVLHGDLSIPAANTTSADSCRVTGRLQATGVGRLLVEADTPAGLPG